MSKAEIIEELKDIIGAVNKVYDINDKYSESYDMDEDTHKEMLYEKLDYIVDTAENLIQELRRRK